MVQRATRQERMAPEKANTQDPDRPTVTSAPEKSGATVTVACKLPSGLILRVFNMVESSEPVMGGGFKSVPKAMPMEQEYTVNGNKLRFGAVPDFKVIGGYALTPGIPLDFWKLWMSQNKDGAYVKNHQVFAYESADETAGVAQEHKAIRSGLEPMSQVNDPRNIKTKNPNMTSVTKGEKVDA